jgi:hypothetical protein
MNFFNKVSFLFGLFFSVHVCMYGMDDFEDYALDNSFVSDASPTKRSGNSPTKRLSYGSMEVFSDLDDSFDRFDSTYAYKNYNGRRRLSSSESVGSGFTGNDSFDDFDYENYNLNYNERRRLSSCESIESDFTEKASVSSSSSSYSPLREITNIVGEQHRTQSKHSQLHIIAKLDSLALDNSAVSSSPGSAKKGVSPSLHEINQKHISAINKVLNQDCSTPSAKKRDIESLGTPDIFYMNALNDKDARRIEAQFKSLKETPDRSKENIMRSVAKKSKSAFAGELNDAVSQNDQLCKAYVSSSNVTNFMAKNLALLSSPEKADVSAVDMNHVRNPVEKYDNNGRVIDIHGGHDLSSYLRKNLLNLEDHVFVGVDDNIIGVNVQGAVSKTLHRNFTPEQIASNVRQARAIAHTVDRFKLSETRSGSFIGSYYSSDNPLLYKTQFPVLVVSDKNQSDIIYVGEFAKLSTDGSLVKKTPGNKLYLSKAKFDEIVNKSLSDPYLSPKKSTFISKTPGVVVCEITEPLKEHFNVELGKVSMTKFPAPIYAIKTK